MVLSTTAPCRNATSDTSVQPLDVYGGRWHLGLGQPPEDHGTSHASVVDAAGGVFAMTSSVNTAFGSRVFSPSTGEGAAPPPPPSMRRCTRG